ncbi:hypothetical protein ACA087_07890 [Pseudomonas chlororaphis]
MDNRTHYLQLLDGYEITQAKALSWSQRSLNGLAQDAQKDRG